MTEGLLPWPAPAKINLFLHVTGRRDDGYHLLQTMFQFLDFGDVLRFAIRADGVIHRAEDLPGVAEADDLCLQAARLLQRHTGCTPGATIYLEKHIPQGGGLGGGSSNAATVLLALNELWETGLGRDELARLGLRLGADVPVFIGGAAAWAEGVGEALTPVELETPYYVLLAPGVSVSTVQIFADPELTRNSPAITIRDFHEGRTRNDLEAVVFKHAPGVKQALSWLGQFGPARMTGSGSCLFLPVTDKAQAERIVSQCPASWQCWLTRGVNTHPLAGNG
ncbi:MAG: 4-(cytidine 5'-diphospho)-2-C-methyl-D-erythritol kinase [Gammaproteobacteria bacterium]|nr:MAG: 4-(cytidine 5'-diphospho)-2-C-methyl-D-erythritol kinase [Gammaproteobacteria bacterium]